MVIIIVLPVLPQYSLYIILLLKNLIAVVDYLKHSTHQHCMLEVPLHSIHFIPSAGILNTLGLPVTQCPLGLGEEGLPLGVQVGAGKLQDHLTLEVALFLEKAFGGWRNPETN